MIIYKYYYNIKIFSGCKLTQGLYKTDADGVKIVDGKCVGYHRGGSSTTAVKVCK